MCWKIYRKKNKVKDPDTPRRQSLERIKKLKKFVKDNKDFVNS